MVKRLVCASCALVLAACSSSGNKPGDGGGGDGSGSADAKIFMDAPGPFDCVGDSAPTTANPNVMLSGSVTELDVGFGGVTENAVTGANIDACISDCNGPNKLATGTSDSSGNFSLGPLVTNSMPLAAYAYVTYMSDAPVYVYPPEAITADVSGVPVLALTQMDLTFAKDGHYCSNTTSDGLAVVAVTDCAGKVLTDSTNITVTAEQNGTPIMGAKITDLSKLSSTAAGLFLVCNIPPGATTLGATYMGMTFLATDVNVAAADVTETEVRPGY